MQCSPFDGVQAALSLSMGREATSAFARARANRRSFREDWSRPAWAAGDWSLDLRGTFDIPGNKSVTGRVQAGDRRTAG
jgi:hypothetical protein